MIAAADIQVRMSYGEVYQTWRQALTARVLDFNTH